MGVRFACHGCGKPLNIKTELAGKRGKCPACGLRFRIPEEDQEFSIPLTPAGEAENGEDETEKREQVPTPGPTALVDQASKASPATAPETELPKIAFDPFEDAQAQWYVRPPSGGRYGPADGPTLRLWINEGRITQDTLLWRDGWAQWRSGNEVIPQWSSAKNSNDLAAPSSLTETPATSQPPTSPTALQQLPAEITLKPHETKPQEPYPSLKRRRNSNQRVIIVVCLLVSVLLLAALIAVILWPRQSEEETHRVLGPNSMSHLAIRKLHPAASACL